MPSTFLKAVAGLTAAALLAGCSGTKSTLPSSPTSNQSGGGTGQTSATQRKLSVTVTLPGKAAASAAARSAAGSRKPKYVSPDTAGLIVTTTDLATSTSKSGTAGPTTNVDVSAASPLCTAIGGTTPGSSAAPIAGSRVCTFPVAADQVSGSGVVLFNFTTYDEPEDVTAAGPPVTLSSQGYTINSSTTYPKANALGTGSERQAVSTTTTALNSIVIGGTPASVAVIPAQISADASQPFSYELGISVYDADHNLIIAGPNDNYSSPVTVTNAEQNGSGYTTVTESPAPAVLTSPLNVSESSQTLTVNYQPVNTTSPQPGTTYSDTISVGANSQTVSAEFNPIFIYSPHGDTTLIVPHDPGSSSATAAPNYPLVAFPASSQGIGARVTINEPAYGTGTFTVTPSAACGSGTSAVATIASPVTNDTTFEVSQGSAQSDVRGTNGLYPCTFTFTDSNGGTALLEVSNRGVLSNGGAAINPGTVFGGSTGAVTFYTAPTTNGANSFIPYAQLNDTNLALAQSAVPSNQDPSENTLYVLDYGNGTTGYLDTYQLSPSAPATRTASVSIPGAQQLAQDAAGDVYVTSLTNNMLYRYTYNSSTKALNTTPESMLAFNAPAGVAVAPNGTVYVASRTDKTVYQLNSGTLTGQTGTPFENVNISSSTTDFFFSVAVDSNGAVLIAVNDGGPSILYRVPNNGPTGGRGINSSACTGEITGLGVISNGNDDEIYASCNTMSPHGLLFFDGLNGSSTPNVAQAQATQLNGSPVSSTQYYITAQ